MKKSLAFSVLLILFGAMACAQTAPQMFAVFHDNVKPSMNTQYRDALKKLKATCEQQKSPFYWTTIAFDDNSYSHLVPIKAFGDLDKNLMADLETKLGKEGIAGIFADFDKCLAESTSYIITSVPSMSYLTPAAGENFRDILFWYPIPGKDAEAEAIIKEWLDLYQSKKAPSGILTLKLIFGGEPGYAFVGWGKNPVDLVTKENKSNELFSEAAGKLWERTLLITRRYENKRAWVLSDLSNPPPAATK